MVALAEQQGFAGLQEEIAFFKTMKPQVEGRLLYYNSRLKITLGKPAGTKQQQRSYFEKELEKITAFYETNRFLVQYYRSGETFLDDKFFVRVEASTLPAICGTVQSKGLHAMCDGFAAELVAYELLAGHLAEELSALDGTSFPAAFGGNNSSVMWTDSKAALVELLYALYRKGSINNGQAGIKEIAGFLEKAFGVDLGNYYRAFQELRIRKTGRTNYLDQLRSGLVQYMDETDLNYKG